ARTGRFETDVFGTLHGDFPALLAEGIPMELPDPQSLPGRTFIGIALYSCCTHPQRFAIISA
ncbi:MAG: hypothetical protein WAS00_03440, partial [Limnochordia bacterium]